MKVIDLIEWLKGEDPQKEVHIAYNYGDRSHTTVAPAVYRVEEAPVAHSDYFRMPVVQDGDSDNASNVVVLFPRGL